MKAGSSKLIYMIDKSLANMIQRRWEKIQINKIRDKKMDITTNTNKIQRIMREYLKSYIQTKIRKSRRNW
jgi:hypothetical protein